MKKILFVTTRAPFAKSYSGDRLRSSSIINFLSKNNYLKVVYTDNQRWEKKNINQIYFKNNYFLRIISILRSIIKLEPMQNGFFFSKKLKDYIKLNCNKYDTIIFHLFRSAQYLPNNFKGKKILEMTDFMSENYNQTTKKLSLFNPLFYLYFIEKILVKKYEIICLKKFDKVIIVSKEDIKNLKLPHKSKILQIQNGCKKEKNIFKFNKKNNTILFIGNIKYLPNKIACKNFINNILPKISTSNSKINFKVIGNISKKDKYVFNSYKNVKALGPVKNLAPFIKQSFCGICNIDIKTGFQNKILTYMSFGLPCITSYPCSKGSSFKNNKELLLYNSATQFINLIFKLKNNSKISTRISKKSFQAITSNYSWNSMLNFYKKII